MRALNGKIALIEALEVVTGWDNIYMTENPEKVVDILKTLKVDAYQVNKHCGWIQIEELKRCIK